MVGDDPNGWLALRASKFLTARLLEGLSGVPTPRVLPAAGTNGCCWGDTPGLPRAWLGCAAAVLSCCAGGFVGRSLRGGMLRKLKGPLPLLFCHVVPPGFKGPRQHPSPGPQLHQLHPLPLPPLLLLLLHHVWLTVVVTAMWVC